MQFSIRLLLACAFGCVALPADVVAFADVPPSVTTFAYSGRHGSSALPEQVINALRPPDEPDNDEVEAVTGSEGAAHAVRAPRSFSRAELCVAAASVAQANDLPVPFFTNLIQQESGFRPHAVSPAGAQGIAQFMPRVANAYGLSNPFDPIHALIVSGQILRELIEQFGNLGLAAAAYNAGPKRVLDWLAKRGRLPSETRHYVRIITGVPVERWANRKFDREQLKLPPRARCPGNGDDGMHVASRSPVKVAVSARQREARSGKPDDARPARRKANRSVRAVAQRHDPAAKSSRKAKSNRSRSERKLAQGKRRKAGKVVRKARERRSPKLAAR